MAFHCGHCRSTRTDPLADSYQCADCGGRTYADGRPVENARSTDVVVHDLAAKAPKGLTTTKRGGQ